MSLKTLPHHFTLARPESQGPQEEGSLFGLQPNLLPPKHLPGVLSGAVGISGLRLRISSAQLALTVGKSKYFCGSNSEHLETDSTDPKL